MKILLDTSVLLPGFRYPGLEKKLIGRLLAERITPVITDYIVEELGENIREHYTEQEKAIALDLLLELLKLGVLEVKVWEHYSENINEASQYVPEKDTPILAAIMLPDIDLFITKDEKHFTKNQKLRNTPWQAKIKHINEYLAES
ncbi:MAG: PIN domain-containing protein [Candidatus Bipolaricaulota bacterium]|nr:PIN domain-containing protein [Candidatus Bipolaricaulota bacterium]MDW8141352.1 PIN domain-containing protein [Candidatus Bipolaricaulota bacterium]